MNPIDILHHYIDPNEELFQVVYLHSRAVADFALRLVDNHPEWQVDRNLVEQAALLHDIGVCRVEAPSIHCLGKEPYIRHGVEGAALLRALSPSMLEDDKLRGQASCVYASDAESMDLSPESLEACARVCERHTGTGLTREAIARQQLPLPLQDYSPISLEEELICFADKFFSKTHLDRERSFEQARTKLEKFGEESLARFDNWGERFL